MNYLEQIQLFTEYVRTEDVSPEAQFLWYKLMQINNECGWKREFKINNFRLLSEVGLKTEPPLIKHRQELIDNHMIEFQPGASNRPSTYRILEFYRDKDGIVKPGYDGDTSQKNTVKTPKTTEKQDEPANEIQDSKPKQTRKKKGFYNEILNLFNDHHGGMPTIRTMSDPRKEQIDRLLKKYSLDDIKTVIFKAEKSSFLNGDNDRGWTASFDWITDSKRFLKILEGTYDNKTPQNKSISADDFLTAVGSGIIDINGTPVEELKTFQDYEIVNDSLLLEDSQKRSDNESSRDSPTNF